MSTLGHLTKERFLAAIEPWHGNQVATYRGQAGRWDRSVIDSSLTGDHTIVAADFDGDGGDEIVVGFRRSAKSVYLYSVTKAGQWERQNPGRRHGWRHALRAT
jgi:hypothetical protein